jgi:hypothetical protein
MSYPPGGAPAAPRASTFVSSGAQRPPRFSGFVEWVLEESTNKAQLQAWFVKPKKEDIIQPLPKENATYAQVPGELRRCNLLKSAERYYEKEEHRRRPSTWLVALLTLIFFIPALLVFLLLRGFHAIFPVSPSLIPPGDHSPCAERRCSPSHVSHHRIPHPQLLSTNLRRHLLPIRQHHTMVKKLKRRLQDAMCTILMGHGVLRGVGLYIWFIL